MDEKTPNLEAGHLLGNYRILKQIGAGGMGEVYLAEDARLRRKIALKVLHRDLDQDDERLRRFEQEAFAASGLNHPNILTIYEFGAENETHFLASEFVEGETLRDRMRRDRLTIGETLHIAIQAAEALSAAHEAKIIHRDIKPENIMVRPDHLVKVLDFGLAKLTEKKIKEVDSEAETVHGVITEPGMIMGTFAYMSPEQSRGKETDARSDIWSLGCVMYEMVGGKSPFLGETPADCLVAIIRQNYVPLALANENVPAQLDDIVGKCLEKDREERYQTIKDLLVDLRRLKRKLDFEVEKKRSGSSEYITGEAKKTQIIPAKISTADGRAQTVSSAEYLVRGISRHKFVVLGILAFLALGAAGFALYKYGFFTRQAKAGLFTSSQKLNFTRLAASGKVSETAVSPDGKYAAYVTTSAKKKSIRLRQIATNSDVEIVAPREAINLLHLRFSPDGNHIYYVEPTSNGGTIYKVAALGGAETKIAERTTSGAVVSPDGKTIAFLRTDPKRVARFLQLAEPDGSNEQTLLHLEDAYAFQRGLAPAWSPDGKAVAFIHIELKSGQAKLSSVSIADGSQRELNGRDWASVAGIAWLPDGSLIVSGNEKSIEQVTPQQLWLIIPDAVPQRITNDLSSYSGISATATGDALVTTESRELFNLCMVPDNDAARAIQIPSSMGIKDGIRMTPDGKLIFSSTAGGNPDIWTMNSDGTDRRQLTAKQGTNSAPSMTSDGRYIVFYSDRAGWDSEHVFRMDADGSNLKQLTAEDNRQWSPRLSPDGQWVYYIEAGGGELGLPISKMSIEGGKPTIIARNQSPAFFAQIDVSPRSGTIAYEQKESQVKGDRKIFIISPEGAPIKTLTLPPTAQLGAFHWMPDERAIAFVDSRDDRANIWTIALDGNSEAKPLTNFKVESILDFAWSPDGKQLVVVRGTTIIDAVLISEAK
jgi:serine/threonine protein kinase/Tol biopolymer transport system component